MSRIEVKFSMFCKVLCNLLKESKKEWKQVCVGLRIEIQFKLDHVIKLLKTGKKRVETSE